MRGRGNVRTEAELGSRPCVHLAIFILVIRQLSHALVSFTDISNVNSRVRHTLSVFSIFSRVAQAHAAVVCFPAGVRPSATRLAFSY